VWREPSTGWTAPTPISSTFQQTVQLIIKHRQANLGIAARLHLSLDSNTVARELLSYNHKRLGMSEVVPSPPFPATPSAPWVPGAAGQGSGVIAGLKRAAAGTAVVLDWLGAGGNPVAQELAEKRAAICVDCKKNVPGDWYTVAPAEIIRQGVKAWQALKGSSFAFQNSQGEKLKSCDVCKCLMPLKIFVPLEHITAKTKPDVMAELPEWCWIKKENVKYQWDLG
jgi:hypothetical protein